MEKVYHANTNVRKQDYIYYCKVKETSGVRIFIEIKWIIS